MPFITFNCRWALPLLTPSLCAQPESLYSSWLRDTASAFCMLPSYVWFCEEFLVYPCKPPAIFALFPVHWGRPFLSLEVLIFENQPAHLGSSSLDKHSIYDSSMQIPSRPQSGPWIPVVWCCFFFFFSTLLRILIITEARVSLWMNFTSLSSS